MHKHVPRHGLGFTVSPRPVRYLRFLSLGENTVANLKIQLSAAMHSPPLLELQVHINVSNLAYLAPPVMD